ncbi:MAG: hypothetical protein P1V97_35785, partial [Planctomycetota bacterium]|nr:hypothetical protein [Planctomycetota bacterium]
YKARQNNLNRQIAIKTLLSVNPDPVEKQRFFSEAEVTGFLDHPNIVPIHDLGVSQTGQPLLAMKLVGGRPWSDLLKPQSEDGAVAKSLTEHLEILLNVS